MDKKLEKPSNTGGKISLFHVAVVSLSLLVTLSAWLFAKTQIENRIELNFEDARDRAVALISDRMTKYEDALSAGVAAVESHNGDIAYANWRIFARNLRIDERYPGINGIGVIHFMSKEDLPSFEARQRIERPDFRVFPPHEAGIHMPITYIEPASTNAAAIGLDVAHEINRRTAAIASRDTGRAQITGPIVLVQDAGRTPGFLFYYPFYSGSLPVTQAERRTRILGVVYAPFVVHKLMEGLLAKDLRQVYFSIRDNGEMIYDEHGAQEAGRDPDPMFTEQISLELYGRTWTLDMRSNLAFRTANANTKPTIILLAGLVIETLIVSLLYAMAQANKRAVSYADRVTLALKEQKEKLVIVNDQLSRQNEDLERFAYVASHDLRTPIRGISGLAEMVQEDLEDYLAQPGANPEIAENLERIQERVQRMEDLTTGIMQASSKEVAASESRPIDLATVLHELNLDFGLQEGQLHLGGETACITADPMNFRSVLENLIGNAIKYHDGKDPLRIIVAATRLEDRLQMTVADNGPGIDPRDQKRIFEVFETLNNKLDVESTGIGLSIVKNAVEKHGGTVSIDSTPGNGAIFYFDWPYTPQSTSRFSEGKAA